MTYLKVEVFIPRKNVVELANELNENGFLQEGFYDYAFSTTLAMGHWRPLEGANPYDGEIGVVKEAEEIKMEFRIKEEEREDVHRIINRVHPFETPVINYIVLA